jgi:two-component system alkaline phosphatase synthesis response regulator PhoP
LYKTYAITLDNKKRILVIDDEIDICIMLKVVLEQNGFIVNYYHKPIIARDKFQSNFYDLIIVDIQMPEINGMQLYREIRKKDMKVKICFLTGSETLFDIAYKFTSVYTFITKPVENKELIKIVNDVLNR